MPVTWRTSRWVRDVAGRTGEPVTWKFLSLTVLNEGKDVPEQFRPVLAFGRTAHRVLAAADQKYGQEAVERLYSALGRRLHYENAGPDTVTLATAVAEAQLPADLVDAVEDSSLDTVVRASHDEAQARVGTGNRQPGDCGGRRAGLLRAGGRAGTRGRRRGPVVRGVASAVGGSAVQRAEAGPDPLLTVGWFARRSGRPRDGRGGRRPAGPAEQPVAHVIRAPAATTKPNLIPGTRTAFLDG